MKRILTVLVILLSFIKSQAQCDVLGEGFAAGTTVPSGWAFTSIGGTYTTAGNFGLASPSIQYNATADRVVTTTFSGAFSFSFWIKGQGTDANSALLVEKSVDGVAFTTVENILPMPTVGTTKSYSITPTITVLRFTYTKSVGNLAFDDVCIKSVPLSVDFYKLNLKSTINTNLLSWQTTTEKNNAQFQIERSQNGEIFSKIGEVKGRGNSNVEQNYTFTDASPVKGINYYRLRQVDFDGTETISKIVSTTFDGKGQNKFKAYPTLTQDLVNIELNEEGKTEIAVRDLTGRVLLTKNTEGVSNATLNLGTLANGLYIMSVRSNDTFETIKIQKY
jgi:Secretion system C-terminal sorting domain